MVPHKHPPPLTTTTPLPKKKQTLLQHAEIQHRILEANPLLEAFDGFRELKAGGRRLSAEEVGCFWVLICWVWFGCMGGCVLGGG